MGMNARKTRESPSDLHMMQEEIFNSPKYYKLKVPV